MIIMLVLAKRSKENMLLLKERELLSQIPTIKPIIPIPKLYKNNWQ